MNYKEILEFLYSQVPMFQNLGAGAYKPGLGTTLALARHWGEPQKQLRSAVHIAGTNGKGSTAHTLAAVLQSAGYKTGLYTSPHLLDFRERIRVDGKPVSEDFVVEFVNEYLRHPELQALHPTFFELTTVMALRYFADCDVDVAVIEVGLGGRLDCTNIISPSLCVITNISLDHMALLGNTEPEIAREKAGIIKPGVPVVIGNAEGAVREVFEKKAVETGAPVVFACDRPYFSSAVHNGDVIIYEDTVWGDISGELTGECQLENTATVIAALEILKDKFTRIDSGAVRRGFASVCELTGLMGRWMTISDSPVRVICDTGHNIGGWRHLGPKLASIAGTGRLSMVLGFVNDKDINAIVDTFPRNASYYFASPSVKRGRPSEETAAVAAQHGIDGRAFSSVAEAYASALADAAEGDTVFVGGSTFVVSDLLSELKQKKLNT